MFWRIPGNTRLKHAARRMRPAGVRPFAAFTSVAVAPSQGALDLRHV
jgi:hypothetical protein